MSSVNVAELKNRLSHYLRLVRRGETVLVKSRDRVVARLEPAGGSDRAETGSLARLAELEARGVLKRGRGKVTPALLRRRPTSKASVVAALLEEREEGR